MADGLLIDLRAEQIAAAVDLQAYMPSWACAGKVFSHLRELLPDFDPVSCYIKAAVVDRLYGTNVYQLYAMVEHISDVMSGTDAVNSDPVELVEMIATLNGRRQVSFASKFAHFFIDADRCPIYDRYALLTLRSHLEPGSVKGEPPDYGQYAGAIESLRKLAGLQCSTGELDCYLWLRGLYRQWQQKGEKAAINKEAAELFADPKHKRLLDILDPA